MIELIGHHDMTARGNDQEWIGIAQDAWNAIWHANSASLVRDRSVFEPTDVPAVLGEPLLIVGNVVVTDELDLRAIFRNPPDPRHVPHSAGLLTRNRSPK